MLDNERRRCCGRTGHHARDWEHRKRHVLQRAVRDDEQTFAGQPGRDRTEHHLAQAPRGFRQPGMVAAGRQQIEELPRRLLDLFPVRQLVARHQVRADRPDVAAILSERVLQEERLGVEHLRLNLAKRERLGLRDRRVARARASDLGLRVLVLAFELGDGLVHCRRLLRRVRSREELRLLGPFPVHLQCERTLTIKQGDIHALPDTGAGLGEQLEQTARARPFARLERQDVEALRGACRVEPHEDVDIGVERALLRGEVGRARQRVVDVGAERLIDREILLQETARASQVAAIAFGPGQVPERGGFVRPLLHLAGDGQRLLRVLDRLVVLPQAVRDAAQIVEQAAFAHAVLDLPLHGERLPVVSSACS